MKLDNEQMEKITQLMASGVIDASIQKDIFDTWFGNKMITGSFTNQYIQVPYFKTSSYNALTTSAAHWATPSVTDQYPITNFAWTQVRSLDDYPSEIYSLYSNNNMINTYIKEISLVDTDKFIARLEHTRIKQNRTRIGDNLELSAGHTYDPWHRSISSHQQAHYPKLSIDNRFGDEVELQTKVGNNHQECALFWAFSSTIDKKPITLILYTIAEFDYVNKKKKNSHLKSIHPYMCCISDNYNLRHTP